MAIIYNPENELKELEKQIENLRNQEGFGAKLILAICLDHKNKLISRLKKD